MSYTTLITPGQLQALQASGTPLMVFDCSFDLMNPAAGDGLFAEGHVPGAVYMHLERDLSVPKHTPTAVSAGRHPLPDRDTLAERLRLRGFRHGMQAVVYDRQGAQYCARLWWMLKWCGHDAVAVLDGGLPAWTAAGGALAQGPSEPSHTAGNFQATTPLLGHVGTQEVLQHLEHASQILIDARAAARFRGETEPLDPVAGHIPGALNRPFPDNFLPDGRFKPATTLRAEFEALLAGRAAHSVVHQCGSGVTALANLLAMEIAGLGGSQLYPGSWSEWCNTPGLPCARG